MCSIAKIELTSIRQPRRMIGQTAAELMIDLINGKQIDNPRVVLPVELIVRESTVGS